MIRGVRKVVLEDFDEAIVLLDQAIALDPGFAPALALCAAAHEGRLTHGGAAPAGVDDKREALDLAERALAADSNDAMVLMTAGTHRLILAGDEMSSFPLLLKAEEMNPNSLLIANVTSYCFWHAGRIEESIARFLRALSLARGTPETVWTMNGLAGALMSVGRIEEALDWGLRVLEQTDTIASAHCTVAAAYAHLGRHTEAEAMVRKALASWPDMTIKGMIGPKTAPREQFRLLEEGLLKAGLPAT